MYFKYVLLGIYFFLCTSAGAQNAVAQVLSEKTEEVSPSFFDYLVADSIMEITMIADFFTIRKNKYQEEYYSGHLNFIDSNNTVQSFPVSFRTRGKSRKKVCFHPALKLKFPKKELQSKDLSDDNKYKLVCQCNSGKLHRQSLFREYLAYKIYNLISPYSFEVHLLNINYIETGTMRKEQRYAFLLESEKSVEKRLNGIVIDRDLFALDQISRTESIRMSLFQYMIANTDWNVPALHNVKLLLDKNKQLIPIPYDYDYSGLAKTPYASPNPDYPIKTVTDRYFLSADYTESEINEQLVYFHQQKKAVKALITNFEFLNKRSRRFVDRFINRFYKTIEDPRRVAKELVK